MNYRNSFARHIAAILIVLGSSGAYSKEYKGIQRKNVLAAKPAVKTIALPSITFVRMDAQPDYFTDAVRSGTPFDKISAAHLQIVHECVPGNVCWAILDSITAPESGYNTADVHKTSNRHVGGCASTEIGALKGVAAKCMEAGNPNLCTGNCSVNIAVKWGKNIEQEDGNGRLELTGSCNISSNDSYGVYRVGASLEPSTRACALLSQASSN